MNTTTAIRQSEFAAMHGLYPRDIVPLRDKHLAAHEWHREGVTIYWDIDAANRVSAILAGTEPKAPEPVVSKSDTITVRVICPCRNHAFAYAALDGVKIPVLLQRRGANLTGKTINVKVGTDSNGATSYTQTQ